MAPGTINTERVQRLPEEPEWIGDVHARDEVAGRRGAPLLFAVAVGLHIFATDNVLAEHFPVRLTGRWRFVLAGRPLTGWLVATPSSPQELR